MSSQSNPTKTSCRTESLSHLEHENLEHSSNGTEEMKRISIFKYQVKRDLQAYFCWLLQNMNKDMDLFQVSHLVTHSFEGHAFSQF